MRWSLALSVCALVAGCTSNTVDIEDDDGGDAAASTTGGTSGVDDGADDVVTTTPPPPPGDSSGDPPEPTTVGTTTPPPPPDTGVEPEGPLPPGRYLLVVSTVVAPDLPLQWIVLVADDGGSFDARSLSLNVGSTTEPREPVGEFWTSPLDPACTVCTPPQEVFVPGAANPITGSDIVATFELNGTMWDEWYCGEVYGEILSPISSPLDGSTFALIPLSGEMLPLDFPFGC